MLEYFKERRKRQKKPLAIIIISIVFFSLPFFNYISLVYRNNIALTDFVTAYEFLTIPPIGIIGIILLLLPFAVGVAILSVKKWGWYFFIAYALALIVFNLAVLIKHPVAYNIFANIQTLFLFSAIIYFMQKNISAPYMHAYPRGWRMQHRKLLEISVTIDGKPYKTKDIGNAGIFAIWPNCNKNINDEFKVSFELDGQSFTEIGAIARIEEEGVGIAFREISDDTKKQLKKTLKKLQ